MARYLLIAIFFAAPFLLNAQTLNGKVYRVDGKDSTAALPNASVYYSGSMLGTLTRENGSFSIEAKAGKVPLIVSCIGYYSTTVSSYSPDKPLKVYLKPKLHQLRQVTIGFDGLTREEKERIFKREFLGISDYAQSCIITNMADVDFEYSKKTGILKAYSDKPLEIDNKKLGYHISYFLDHFTKTAKNVVFAGNYIFTDVSQADNRKKILRNRANAYDGSRMEFVRALWSNSLKKAHYKIYSPYPKQADADSIICLNDKLEKVVNLKYRVVILHNGNNSFPSTLSQTISDCYIDKDGFYDTGLQWLGDMSIQRIGNLLPFEYQPVKATSDSIYVVGSIKTAPKVIAPVSAAKGNKALKDFDLFKSIVLAPNTLLDTRLVVKKWRAPIRYKIYGRFGAKKSRSDSAFVQVDSLFAQVARLTGLSISKTDNDSEVNFFIITEGIAKAKGLISAEAMDYLEKKDKEGGEYYTSNENGFATMIELVRPATIPAVQRQIMNGLGFTGIAEGYTHSLFDYRATNLPKKIQALDARIISTLYNPAIQWGMTESELDDTLLKIFAGKKPGLK